ncbi:IS3 family transposase [bacterium]|nr:IS3 family transposase [bacterium]
MPTQRRKFDKAFKLRAVEMSYECDRIKDLADELGIRAEVIYRWRAELSTHKEKSFPGEGKKAQSPEEAQISLLKKQLSDKEMELENLKKGHRHLLQERREIYTFIKNHRHQFPVEMMCKVMGVGRSGYYAWMKRPESNRSIENQAIRKQIREIFYASKQTYGSPRVTEELKASGVDVSRPRVARFMKKDHLRSKMKRKFVHTTNSRHNFNISPNLLDRQFQPGKINRAWVSDITYIFTTQGWIYLTVIIDLGDRKVIGWSLSDSMHAKTTIIAAWNMAIINRPPTPGLIFHSDRGVQYACDEFRRQLDKQDQVIQSMSRKGNCWDNAVAESFFKSLKTEWLYDLGLISHKQARLAVFEYIEIWYNRKRLHSSLGYQAPENFITEENLLSNVA